MLSPCALTHTFLLFFFFAPGQVEDLKELFIEMSEDEDDHQSPEAAPLATTSSSSFPAAHQAFLFGASALPHDIRQLHPSPEHIFCYWQAFKVGVDPLTKIVHVPTTESLIMKAAENLDELGRGPECFMFAMYYAAVTSFSAQDCREKLGAEKPELLSRYRFGVEQSLARAGFLNTQEMIVLQALALFLVCPNSHNFFHPLSLKGGHYS
jgi:hypothetical protein